MSIASELVASPRRYRRVSGRALARSAGASQASLVQIERGREDATATRLDRLLRQLDYQLTVLPTRRGTAASAAEGVRRLLEGHDQDNALRVVWQLASDLQASEPALRVALCVTPPAATGEARFDALVAGVVHYLLARGGLPLPSWLSEDWRTLAEPWDVETTPSLRPQARARTPVELVAHGVFLDAGELVNV